MIAHVALDAPAGLAGFYGETLGLPVAGDRVAVGATTVELRPAAVGDPFYHFALLVPGDRFAAAHAWAAERVGLLPAPWEREQTVFAFDAWDAQACYFLDPAGNIVELIAHRGIGEGGEGPFSGAELLRVSEVGIVAPDLPAAAARLEADAGVRVWDGSVEGPLAFVGRRAHTLILAPPGRGWLPTGRPAEIHPVAVTLVADVPGVAELPEARARVTATA